MSLAQSHLAAKGVTLKEAYEFVVANLATPQVIFDVAKQYGVTNAMLAEIANVGMQNVSAADVRNFFSSHNMNSAVLDDANFWMKESGSLLRWDSNGTEIYAFTLASKLDSNKFQFAPQTQYVADAMSVNAKWTNAFADALAFAKNDVAQGFPLAATLARVPVEPPMKDAGFLPDMSHVAFQAGVYNANMSTISYQGVTENTDELIALYKAASQQWQQMQTQVPSSVAEFYKNAIAYWLQPGNKEILDNFDLFGDIKMDQVQAYYNQMEATNWQDFNKDTVVSGEFWFV